MKKGAGQWTTTIACRAALGVGMFGVIGCSGDRAFRTHPMPQERIDAMEKTLKKLDQQESSVEGKPVGARPEQEKNVK